MPGIRTPFSTSLRASAHTGAAIRSFSGDREGRNYGKILDPVILRGASKEGPEGPSLAVSIRGFLGGKNTESSPLNGVSFAAALSKCAGGTFVA